MAYADEPTSKPATQSTTQCALPNPEVMNSIQAIQQALQIESDILSTNEQRRVERLLEIDGTLKAQEVAKKNRTIDIQEIQLEIRRIQTDISKLEDQVVLFKKDQIIFGRTESIRKLVRNIDENSQKLERLNKQIKIWTLSYGLHHKLKEMSVSGDRFRDSEIEWDNSGWPGWLGLKPSAHSRLQNPIAAYGLLLNLIQEVKRDKGQHALDEVVALKSAMVLVTSMQADEKKVMEEHEALVKELQIQQSWRKEISTDLIKRALADLNLNPNWNIDLAMKIDERNKKIGDLQALIAELNEKIDSERERDRAERKTESRAGAELFAEKREMKEKQNELESARRSLDAEKNIAPFEIEVRDPSKLTANHRAIYEALKAKAEIPFRTVTNLLTAHEAFLFNIRNQNARQEPTLLTDKMKELSSQVSKTSEPAYMKREYQGLINQSLGRDLVYNRDYFTSMDILCSGKKQCRAGTMFDQVFMRSHLGAQEFRKLNPVVIFTPGHIMSGYMKKDADGAWMLQGVEMTVKGEGIVPFGKVSELNQPLRIVDAEDFALVEIFKSDLKDSSKTVSETLARAAIKYEINLPHLEELVSKEGLGGSGDLLRSSSPYAFGRSDNVPEGDQEIIEAGVIDPKSYNAGGSPNAKEALKVVSAPRVAPASQPATTQASVAPTPLQELLAKEYVIYQKEVHGVEVTEESEIAHGINYYREMLIERVIDRIVVTETVGERREKVVIFRDPGAKDFEVLVRDEEASQKLAAKMKKLRYDGYSGIYDRSMPFGEEAYEFSQALDAIIEKDPSFEELLSKVFDVPLDAFEHAERKRERKEERER